MPPILIPHDPEGCHRLAQRMPAVRSNVSAGDQVTRDQLKAIAANVAKNPLKHVTKNNQSASNTCAANGGELMLAIWFFWQTGKVLDFSRLWLYLQGKLKWDSRSGRFRDDGCSIPSIAEVLLELGAPLESLWPFNPDSRTWPTVEKFKRSQTPEILSNALQHRAINMTPVSQDFDVAVARVALGDPFFWGTGWPFPNGGSGHATCGAWIRWDERLRDFVLLMGNSHLNNEEFVCTRRQFESAMRNNTFGAFHIEGNLDLNFRANQLVM